MQYCEAKCKYHFDEHQEGECSIEYLVTNILSVAVRVVRMVPWSIEVTNSTTECGGYTIPKEEDSGNSLWSMAETKQMCKLDSFLVPARYTGDK